MYLDNFTKSLIVALVIVVIGVGGFFIYSQDYSGNSENNVDLQTPLIDDFLTPLPKISLTEISKNVEEEWDYVLLQNGLTNYQCIWTDVSAYFTIVNAGDIDGFINVNMSYNGNIITQNRYFVRADEEVRKDLSDTLYDCNLNEDNLQLKSLVENP